MNKLRQEFGKKKKRNQNYIRRGTIIVGIILFTGVISDSIISKIALIIGVFSIFTIILDISTDVQYLEKRIEDLEDIIPEIEEK